MEIIWDCTIATVGLAFVSKIPPRVFPFLIYGIHLSTSMLDGEFVGLHCCYRRTCYRFKNPAPDLSFSLF